MQWDRLHVCEHRHAIIAFMCPLNWSTSAATRIILLSDAVSFHRELSKHDKSFYNWSRNSHTVAVLDLTQYVDDLVNLTLF